MKDKIIDGLHLLIAIIIIATLLFVLIGRAITKSDVIVQRNSKYIYVKEYSLYNLDSTIVRYYADKIYPGVVVNKRHSSYYQGIPGKGGHYVTQYYVQIKINDTMYEFQNSIWYYKYNKGDRVTVKESWYPKHHIEIY